MNQQLVSVFDLLENDSNGLGAKKITEELAAMRQCLHAQRESSLKAGQAALVASLRDAVEAAQRALDAMRQGGHRG